MRYTQPTPPALGRATPLGVQSTGIKPVVSGVNVAFSQSLRSRWCLAISLLLSIVRLGRDNYAAADRIMVASQGHFTRREG